MMLSQCATFSILIFTVSMLMIISNAQNEAGGYIDQFTRNHCYYRRVSICYYANLSTKQTQNISDFQILEDCKFQFNGSLTKCVLFTKQGCDDSCEEIVQAYSYVENPSNVRNFYDKWSATSARNLKFSWKENGNRGALYLFQAGIRYRDTVDTLDDTVAINNLNSFTYRIPPFCVTCQIRIATILNGSVSNFKVTDCVDHQQATSGFIEHSSELSHDDRGWHHKTVFRTNLVRNIEFRPDDVVEAFTFVPYTDNLYIVATFKSERIFAFSDDVINDMVNYGCPLYYFFTKLTKKNQCQEQLSINKLTRLNMPETQRGSRGICRDYALKLLARTISPIGIPRIVLKDTANLYFFTSNYTLLLEGMSINDLITNHSNILSTYEIVHEDVINMTKGNPFRNSYIVLQYMMVALLFLSTLIITGIIVRFRSGKKQSRGFLSNVKNLEDYQKSKKSSSVHYHDFGSKIDEWEIERCLLELNKDDKLGSGNFGNVFKGYLTRTTEIWEKTAPPEARRFENGILVVAVKMLQSCSTPKEAANFFDEINLMKSLGYHERLVNMIGCTTAHEPLCLIVEYCSGGDLHEYLRRKHDYMVEKQIAGIMIDPGFVSLDILLTFARQVACGMEYLSDKGFVHRDLAARNVLLDDIKNVKICDFGLCRTYNNENLYYTSRGGRLPIKWMALESISDYKFTTASDVWSFGILLFEIITLARCPYEGVDPCCMEEYLRRGKRMDKPINCPDELYDLMLLSWHEDPSKRPSFSTLKSRIQTMIDESADVDYNYLSLVNEDTHYCNVNA